MPKDIRVELLGPVTLYLKKEDDCWVAAIDPFSIFGEGETKEAATRRSLANLRRHLTAAAEELAKRSPGKSGLKLLCRLRDEDKEGAEDTREHYVIATYEETRKAPRIPPVVNPPIRALSASRLANVFRHHGRVGVPEFVCG